MIYDCLHVYEASLLGRMAADSFRDGNVRAICIGEKNYDDDTHKIIFHTPITPDNVAWVLTDVMTKVKP